MASWDRSLLRHRKEPPVPSAPYRRQSFIDKRLQQGPDVNLKGVVWPSGLMTLAAGLAGLFDARRPPWWTLGHGPGAWALPQAVPFSTARRGRGRIFVFFASCRR